MSTVVLKFGGTSVENNEKLNIVAQKIIDYYNKGNNVVVVVSAQGKMTDILLKQAKELDETPNSRELDVLLSSGEQISISKLSILLNKLGYKAISLTGWQAGIYTNLVYQNSIINYIDNTRILQELSNGKIVIIAGFQGINENADITTLGRGGSDTTAVSIAASLNADKCLIYSDVEGVFTADPKKVENAKKIKEISYDEMLEISNEGAEVLHNRCIEIAKKFNIPIIAKSTFKKDVGTIVHQMIEKNGVKSIVKNDNFICGIIKNKSEFDFKKMYMKFIENNIIPIDMVKCDNFIYFVFNEKFYKKLSDLSIKISDLSVIRLSKISIIGNGFFYDEKLVKRILKYFFNLNYKIKQIKIDNSKICFIFEGNIDNNILNKLHDEFVVKLYNGA